MTRRLVHRGHRPAQSSGGRVLGIAVGSDGFDTDCSFVAVRLNQLRRGCEQASTCHGVGSQSRGTQWHRNQPQGDDTAGSYSLEGLGGVTPCPKVHAHRGLWPTRRARPPTGVPTGWRWCRWLSLVRSYFPSSGFGTRRTRQASPSRTSRPAGVQLAWLSTPGMRGRTEMRARSRVPSGWEIRISPETSAVATRAPSGLQATPVTRWLFCPR